MRRIPVVLAVAAASAAVAAPAPAIDEQKPTAPCGQQLPDRAGDVPNANLDLTGGFFKHEPAKAGDATTINLVLKELDKTIPDGSTFVSWNLYWTGGDDVERFVRAVTDFSGVLSYEFGQVENAGVVTVSRALGVMPGAFFEGKDGVVQLVIPQDHDGKAGTTLKGPNAITYTGSPGIAAAPTPTRGPLTAVDTSVGKPYTIGPCTAPPAAPSEEPPATPPPSGDAPADQGLPVKVLTKKARAKKGRLAIKLQSSEPLTQVAGQLVKGRKVLGKGTLAKLDGKGTLKLRVKKARKGTYRLDLAGSDAEGRRRFGSVKLKLR